MYSKIGAALLGVCLLLSALTANAQTKAGLSLETGFVPAHNLTVWPLDISQGYPLVRGQVGNVKGVFMLDTGTPWGLLLNRARVPLSDARYLLSGSTASGEKLEVFRAGRMPVLRLHGQAWRQVHGVQAADLAFFEQGTGIGPFLGFIGANFFADTALTLDYARRVAVIRKVQVQTGVPLLELPSEFAGDTVIASVQYRGDNPAFPVFDALLGTTPVRVMLDSGNPGVTLDADWLTELRAAGTALPFSPVKAATTYRAMPLNIAALVVPTLGISASIEPIKVAGQPDPRLIKIGFPLLSHVGVTWNYRLQTMSFFTP